MHISPPLVIHLSCIVIILHPFCRDNPGREVVVRFERNGEAFELPVVPELSPSDNFGQIGVKLAPNAVIRHRCDLAQSSFQ